MGIAFDSDPRWFQSAEAAASRALSLDPANSEAHCARGQIVWTPAHGYQNAAALRALNASLRINPGCQTARIWQGLIFWHLGLYHDAEKGLKEALAANPYDARTLTFLGQTALFRGDYEEAYDYNLRALSVDPASLWPNLFLPSIPIFLDRPGEAIERVQQARLVVANDPMLITVEAMAAAYCGDCAGALRLAEEALARPQSLIHAHHLLHNAASVFAMCGKPDSAIGWLSRGAESGLPNYHLFCTDPHLRALHNQPDFQSLMERLRAEYDLYAAEFAAGSAPPR
jgi:tetratricopeptide (TPR) repeat protein